MIDGWGISYKIDFRWMSLDLTDDKSTLIQARSLYPSQCWPRNLVSPGENVFVIGTDIFPHCRAMFRACFNLTHHYSLIAIHNYFALSFLSKASFGLWVLSLPACVRVRVCVRMSTPCLSVPWLIKNSSQDHEIWTRGAKHLGKAPYCFGEWLTLSKLTSKSTVD